MSRIAALGACAVGAGLAALTALLADGDVYWFGYKAWPIFLIAYQTVFSAIGATQFYSSVKRCGHREGRDATYTEIREIATNCHR